jgi:hypothetical protein
MTMEQASAVLSRWRFTSESYEQFSALISIEQRRLANDIAGAMAILGKTETHWTDKAIVWERWQHLRRRYSISQKRQRR